MAFGFIRCTESMLPAHACRFILHLGWSRRDVYVARWVPTSPCGVMPSGQREEGNADADVRKAEDVLGIVGIFPDSTLVTANAALAAARSAAASSVPASSVSHWLAAPSRVRQRWLRYTLLGAALGWASFWLYRCATLTSRAPGSLKSAPCC